MERKIYNVVRPREDKDGKTFWDRHGVMIVKEGKISLHVASIPTNNWDGWFHVYLREDHDQQDMPRNNGQARRGNGQGNGQSRPESPPAFDGFDDDIPF